MATPRKVAFHTLGCKLNYAETSSVKRLFENDGYAVVSHEDEADVYVLNTCSVTENADRECRKTVRQINRQNPQAHVVVMGCYAQLKPKEISQIEGVDLVLGAAEKFQLLDYLKAIQDIDHTPIIHAKEIQHANTFNGAFSFGDRTRSFLKVQDGCDYKCTFCTIPKARGSSRSAEIKDVVQQAQQIGKSGVKEIVLTGVNIGDFGLGTQGLQSKHPKRGSSFLDLIIALDDVSEISRFRISSIEPNLCHDEIISFVASSNRFMPHFHMPLQSGNNEILGKMRRRYLRELYAERVEQIRQLMPHACIGVDVITGFPGESEIHFMDTYHFLEELEINYIHAFSYSERDDTPAAEMPDVIPVNIRRERCHALRNLSSTKKNHHYKLHLGENKKVLFEHSTEKYLSGYTDNYIKVLIPASPSVENTILDVELREVILLNGESYVMGVTN